jgi:hypothetical protein
MTSPAPNLTDGDDVRVRVRGPENGSVVPIRPGIGQPSARPHAISRSPSNINGGEPGKIRAFVSQHAGEARESLTSGWLGTDRPRNLTDVSRDLLTGNLAHRAAGLFRLAVYALAYLACAAVDTNKRAAVTFTLFALSLTTAWAISALAS